MARASGRAAVSLLGLVLLLGGVAVAVVLLVLGPRRGDDAVGDLARAPLGCTTELQFSSDGTFYVFEETDSSAGAVPSCAGGPTSGNEFGFELSGPGGRVETSPDRSADYDTDDFAGEAVAIFELEEPGAYEIAVHGPDPGSHAAVGRDPGEIADNYRRAAVLAGVLGGGLGLLLLVIGVIGSRRAGHRSAAGGAAPWPPAPPTLTGLHLPGPPPRPDHRAAPWAPPRAPGRGEPPTDGA